MFLCHMQLLSWFGLNDYTRFLCHFASVSFRLLKILVVGGVLAKPRCSVCSSGRNTEIFDASFCHYSTEMCIAPTKSSTTVTLALRVAASTEVTQFERSRFALPKRFTGDPRQSQTPRLGLRHSWQQSGWFLGSFVTT